MAARNTPSRGAKPDKLWRDALMVAVNREVERGKPTKKLAKLAEKCVEMALNGDMAAIKEIADRLDGRAVQAVTTHEPARVVVEYRDPTQS